MFVESESRPGGSTVCSSPDSSRVCIAVGLERGPLERCQWRGRPGTRIFGFWILVLNLGISGSIRSRSHELHNPESRVRTSGHSLSHPPRIHGPESGGAPAKSTGVRCAETRIQSPESTTEAEGRGADPQIPESGLRRHAQGSRGREGAQDTGSGLSGEGGGVGQGPKGQGGTSGRGGTPES